MLGRFSSYFTKFESFTRFGSHIHHSSLTNSILKSGYATRFGEKNSLDFTLNEIKQQIENKYKVSHNHLQNVLRKVQMQEVDSQLALRIVRCCCYGRIDNDQVSILDQIWAELNKKEVPLTVSHYNTFLQMHAKKGNASESQALFDELSKKGIKPNGLTYQILFSAYCHKGDIENATNVLELMCRENITINEHVYNNLVLGYVNCGNMEMANDAILKMKTDGVPVDSTTLGHLLKGYARAGNLEAINKTFDRFKEENIELLNEDVLEVICELAANDHVPLIDTIAERLHLSMEFNQSFQNAIAKLVSAGQAAIVPKILSVCKGVDNTALAKIFLKELVQKPSTRDQINEAWKGLESIGITLKANLDIFLPKVLESESNELIRATLAEMKAQSVEVTENHFMKLIHLESGNGPDSTLEVVRLMRDDYNVEPRFTFLRDVILPALNGKENPSLALAKLRSIDVKFGSVVTATIASCLKENNLKAAHEIANNHKQLFYKFDLLKQPLVKSFIATNDLKRFVQMTRLIHDSYVQMDKYVHKSDEVEHTDEEIRVKQSELIGDIIFTTVSNLPDPRIKATISILRAFINEGLNMSTLHAERILKLLKADDKSEINKLLSKLSAGELTPKQIENEQRSRSELNLLTSSEVQNIIDIKKSQGNDTIGLEKLQFLAFIREQNIMKVEELLVTKRFELNNRDNALLIQMYIVAEDAEKALDLIKRVNFDLISTTAVKLVALLLNKGFEFSVVEKLLAEHRPAKPLPRLFLLERLMDKLVELGDATLINNLHDAFVKNNHVLQSIDLAVPLIKVHLNKNNLSEAVLTYERLAQELKVTPATMILLRKLIETNDIDLMQSVYDAYETTHGERNALFKLAFAFVENGKDRQAKLIFANKNLTQLSGRINQELKDFELFERGDALKCLLKATEGLYCDRIPIYNSLLNVYTKQNKVEEAFALWEQQLNEDIKPTASFLKKLAALLTANDMPVPFEVPKERNAKSSKANAQTSTSTSTSAKKVTPNDGKESASQN